MALAELLPQVESLSRTDKLQLIRLLADSLERDERDSAVSPLSESFVPNTSLPVWSPLAAHDAAATLLNALETEKSPR